MYLLHAFTHEATGPVVWMGFYFGVEIFLIIILNYIVLYRFTNQVVCWHLCFPLHHTPSFLMKKFRGKECYLCHSRYFMGVGGWLDKPSSKRIRAIFMSHNKTAWEFFVNVCPGGISAVGTWRFTDCNNQEGFYTTSPCCKIWKLECSQVTAAEGCSSGCTRQGSYSLSVQLINLKIHYQNNKILHLNSIHSK